MKIAKHDEFQMQVTPMKITKQVTTVYYVEEDSLNGGCIYGGPFDTRKEAEACLKLYHAKQTKRMYRKIEDSRNAS